MDIRTMPADVLAALAPAVPLIMAEARAGTAEVEQARAVRTAKAFVRSHGREYLAGTETILSTVHPGATTLDAPMSAPIQDEDEDEDEDEDGSCDDDNACGYCGCCYECGSQHEIDDIDVLTSPRGERYCLHSCEHWCDV